MSELLVVVRIVGAIDNVSSIGLRNDTDRTGREFKAREGETDADDGDGGDGGCRLLILSNWSG